MGEGLRFGDRAAGAYGVHARPVHVHRTQLGAGWAGTQLLVDRVIHAGIENQTEIILGFHAILTDA